MRYVQRDQDGNIIGDYANPQPGYAEEALEDDAPELLARYAKPDPIQVQVEQIQAAIAAAQFTPQQSAVISQLLALLK